MAVFKKMNKMKVVLNYLPALAIAVSSYANAITLEDLKKLIEEKLKEPAEIIRNEDIIQFNGYLGRDNIDKLLQELQTGKPRVLKINSGGGEIPGAIQIREKVIELGLEVEVEELCASSCANYIFTAGKKKTINSGSVVHWHGDGQQKDKREHIECKKSKSRYSGYVDMVTDETVALGLRIQELEKNFYAKIGVSSYIARAAQEPHFFNRNVTYTVEDLRIFGVHNVTAEPGYGATEFCEKHNKKSGMNILCLPVSSHMLAYENARTTLGEVCKEDGSLIINSILLQ